MFDFAGMDGDELVDALRGQVWNDKPMISSSRLSSALMAVPMVCTCYLGRSPSGTRGQVLDHAADFQMIVLNRFT